MALDYGTGARMTQRDLSAVADKRRRIERRAVVERMKAVPCAGCHGSYPFFVMDFDHRDPSGKLFEINRALARRAWSLVLTEIAKCDVVCVNCHRLRSWSEPSKKLTSRQQLVAALKNVPCTDCGGSFHYCQKDFDHVRGVKLGQVPKMGSHQAIRDEAAKCEIVCANCHRIRSQAAAKGTTRLAPTDVDMVWKHRSQKSPQTFLRNGGNPSHRPWHSLAGKLPDGVLAARYSITRGAVRKYRKKMNIEPFTPQGVRSEVRCVA
jgi:hypothetical protein